MNAGAVAATLLAAGLAGVLLMELRPDQRADDEPRPVPRAASGAAQPPRLGARPDRLDALLARPLFSATRRPADAAAATGPGPASTALPRMTAILIDGPRRSAIFAPTGSRPIVVLEGGRIGPFTVQRIDPQHVTVVGPEGTRTVRTSFDPSPPQPAALPLLAQPGGIPLIVPPSVPVPGAGGFVIPSGAAR